MTTIKLLEQNILSITLFNAMCKQAKDNGNALTHFNLEAKGSDTVADLKILINGVEVDLVPELTDFIKMLDDQFEKAVETRAKELIMKDQTLQDLARAIEDAEWMIQDRLNKVTQAI